MLQIAVTVGGLAAAGFCVVMAVRSAKRKDG